MNVENETESSTEQETVEENKTTEATTSTTEEAPKSLVTSGAEEEPATSEFVPVTAEDLSFPEGFVVNEELRDEALTIFNNRELSPKEQLQGLMNLQLKMSEQVSQAITDAWDNTLTEWQNAAEADAEIGGDKLKPTLARVNKLIDESGIADVQQALDITGAGIHPAVIKLLNYAASKLTESGTHVQGQPKTSEATRAQRMFPSMKGSNG